MKPAGLVTLLALALAAPAAAQQPAPGDTMRHPMAGHRTPAQGAAPMAQHQGMMGAMMSHRDSAAAGAMGCPMMQGGMAHDSTMTCGTMGGMMHDSAMGGGMMGAMMPGSEHLLAAGATLRLTADQQRRLAAIRDAARTARDAAQRDAAAHQQALHQAMGGSAPDTVALRRHFDGAHQAMGEAHFATLRAAVLARAALTDAQRRQLDSLHAAMRGSAGAGAAQHQHRM